VVLSLAYPNLLGTKRHGCYCCYSDRVFINSGPCFVHPYQKLASLIQQDELFFWLGMSNRSLSWLLLLVPAVTKESCPVALTYPGSSNMDNEVMVPASCDEHGFSVCCILFSYDLVCQQEAVAVRIVLVELFNRLWQFILPVVSFLNDFLE
jgi:hypothetical protein